MHKTAIDRVNRIIRNRDKVRVQLWPVIYCPINVILLKLMWNDPWWRSLLHLLFVAITYGKVSLWLWKSLENSGIFFLITLWPPWKCKWLPYVTIFGQRFDEISSNELQCAFFCCTVCFCCVYFIGGNLTDVLCHTALCQSCCAATLGFCNRLVSTRRLLISTLL